MVHMPLVNMKGSYFIVLLLISGFLAIAITDGDESELATAFFLISFIFGIIWNIFQGIIYLTKKTGVNYPVKKPEYKQNIDIFDCKDEKINENIYDIGDTIEHTIFGQGIVKKFQNNTLTIHFSNGIERNFFDPDNITAIKKGKYINSKGYNTQKNTQPEGRDILQEIIQEEMPWLHEKYTIGDNVECYDFSLYNGDSSSVLTKKGRVVEVVNDQNIVIEFPNGDKKHENLVLSMGTIKKIRN